MSTPLAALVRTLVISVFIACVCLLVVAFADPTHWAANSATLLALHQQSSSGLDHVAIALTKLGGVVVVLGIGVVAAAALFFSRRRADAAVLLTVLLGGAGFTAVLKHLFKEARPQLFTWILPEPGYAFPSGHTVMSFCLAGFVALWLLKNGQAPWRWFLASFALGLAAAVGLSRMYLGVHWPTDVGFSLVLALCWVFSAFAVWDWALDRWQRVNGTSQASASGLAS